VNMTQPQTNMIRLHILTALLWIVAQCNLALLGQSSVPPPQPSFNPAVPPPALLPNPVPSQPALPKDPSLFTDGTMEPLELSGVPGLDVEEFKPFVLRKADANSLLDLIQQHTGWNILRVNRDLPAMEISFNSQGHLTKGETIRIVESLLAMHGLGISKISENLYKAMRAEKINMHVPIWLEGPASIIKPSQKIYMKMFHLKYAPAKEVVAHLTPFKTEVGQMVLLENANSILVTDALLNLQRMEQLLEKLDRPISREELGTKFVVWPTRHAGARELESKLKTMIEGSLKPFLGGTTQVDSDERTGKLIIVTRQENVETLEFILETLDAPVKMKTTSKLFKLQHAETKDIQSILDEVIKNQQRIKQQVQGRKNAAAARPASTTPGKATPGAPAPAAQKAAGGADGGSEGSHEFSDFITISSDERSNAILVYGTKEDIEEIGRMIESLDQPLPQARLDTIFVMVDLTEQNQRGIDALLGNLEWSKFARSPRGEGLFGDPVTENRQVPTAGPDGLFGTADDSTETIAGNVARNSMQGVLGIPGLNTSVPFQLEDWKLTGVRWDQIFALSSERNDVRIFSTPTLSFAHNSPEVHILIEDERNIVIPTYSGYNTGTDGGTSTGQQSKITAKTSLEIKKPKIGMPQIDENGTIISPGSIFMEVEVKAEKFDETQSNTYQGQSLPAKKIREAKSVVTVRDGEIIVLGGLQEVQVDSTESKYNLLSDIPYLGKKFFRPKTVKYTPTELLIFLKPTIMKPGYNNTELNVQSIDERIKGDYKPKFTSPSGQVLGMPDIDGELRKQASIKDKPSSRPQL
jgi:general secretion pathway protein D